MLETSCDPYYGYKVVSAKDGRLCQIYDVKCENKNPFGLIENEYLLVLDDENDVIDSLCYAKNSYRKVNPKPISSNAIGKVKYKNAEQMFAMDLLMNEDVTVKILTGTFGSGKTYLSCAAAFSLIQQGKYDKIVWVRNNVEVKDSNPIGHLKGDYYDKMAVWAMPLADHVGGREMLDTLVDRGEVEVEHLGFMRGRDIKNSIIFCSEAENLTSSHVRLLLGRVAEGSCLILEGDYRQMDKKAFEKSNGLCKAISCLKGQDIVGYVNLSKSVRSKTAQLADLLDD